MDTFSSQFHTVIPYCIQPYIGKFKHKDCSMCYGCHHTADQTKHWAGGDRLEVWGSKIGSVCRIHTLYPTTLGTVCVSWLSKLHNNYQFKDGFALLVRVVACAVTETKCPLLTMSFFSLLSLFSLSLRRVTFLPEGVIVGFQNFVWGFNSQTKIRFGVKQNSGDPPPAPRVVDFFIFF